MNTALEEYSPLDLFEAAPIEPKPINGGPERLLWGVFWQATMDACSQGRIRQEALEWFDSPSHDWPADFQDICAVLHLPAGRIRKLAHERPEALRRGAGMVPVLR